MRRFLVLFLALSLGLATAALAAPAVPQHKLVVYFPSWSAEIDDNAGKAIEEAAKWAADHPRDVMNVLGYASTIGGKRANTLLSVLRAQVVKDLLVAKGVPAGRIKLLPKGATTYLDSPLESRRVEIIIGTK